MLCLRRVRPLRAVSLLCRGPAFDPKIEVNTSLSQPPLRLGMRHRLHKSNLPAGATGIEAGEVKEEALAASVWREAEAGPARRRCVNPC